MWNIPNAHQLGSRWMNHGASIQWNLGELLKIMMWFLYIFCMLSPECSSFRELWGSLPSLESLLNYYSVRLAFLHHFIKIMVPLLPLSLLYLFLIFLIFKNLFYFHQLKKNIYKPLPLCFGSVFVGCFSPRLECKSLWAGTWEAGLTVGPSESGATHSRLSVEFVFSMNECTILAWKTVLAFPFLSPLWFLKLLPGKLPACSSPLQSVLSWKLALKQHIHIYILRICPFKI